VSMATPRSRRSSGPGRAVPEASVPERAAAGSQIVSHLGREIVRGVYGPDDRLPDEAVMLKRYAVSRTALREAYGKLAAKGMIVAKPRVGTKVRPSSHWNMLDPDVLEWHLATKGAEEIARDLYALRRMVEPGAASLAAAARTAPELREIEVAFADMQKTSKSESDLVEADLRFHVAILNATHNPFIVGFASLIHAAMLSTFELSWRGAEAAVIKEERLAQHGQVLDAIREGRPDLARSRMEALLDESIQDIGEALDQRR